MDAAPVRSQMSECSIEIGDRGAAGSFCPTFGGLVEAPLCGESSDAGNSAPKPLPWSLESD